MEIDKALERAHEFAVGGVPVETHEVLSVEDLTMDIDAHVVKRGDREVRLNRKEFGLLEYLIRNKGIVRSRTMILEHVWDANANPFSNTVDVHIRCLRKKVDDGHPTKLIKTVHGYGYKLEA